MTLLPMLPQSRPVDPDWKCQREGDCCTKITEVTMTKEEAAILVHVAGSIVMQFRPLEGNFVAMKAGPCPLYAFEGCTVYESRPYNCRRFICLRPDPESEPFDDGPAGNFWARVKTSRVARRLYSLVQRRHQKWALDHGWVNSHGC